MMELASAPEFEGFDWSGGNAQKNWDAHKVTPLEAEQVFFNRPLLAAEDPGHSQIEKRRYVLGTTDNGRKLFISFTMRGKMIRVISARDMSRRERRSFQS